MVGAAMALTLFAAALVAIVTWHWPPLIEAGRRLDILGKALWIILGGIILIVIALTGKHVEASGAWGRLNVGGGDDDAKPGAAPKDTQP
jgi:hypothetical protein